MTYNIYDVLFNIVFNVVYEYTAKTVIFAINSTRYIWLVILIDKGDI